MRSFIIAAKMKTTLEFEKTFEILRDRRFWKSVIASGLTACTDLSLLLVFREIFHFPHWVSVNSAFIVAIIVNFSLQKFWTFSDRDIHVMHRQFLKFFLLALGNIAANNFIMFVLLVGFGLWYIGAQIIAIGVLALFNFILYRRFVFR